MLFYIKCKDSLHFNFGYAEKLACYIPDNLTISSQELVDVSSSTSLNDIFLADERKEFRTRDFDWTLC